MSKWIKVTTPPTTDRWVLIAPCKHGRVGLGRYERNAYGEGYWIDQIEAATGEATGSSIIAGVRYWMPLPKAPAGTPSYDDTEYEVNLPDLNVVRGILK